ncbi:MAG: hypothetical protein WBA77_21145 [Microcoleaceae cyanobacterium]
MVYSIEGIWLFGLDTLIRIEISVNTKPNPQHSAHWKHSLKDPQIWQLVNDYLTILGEDTITKMGYSYEELQQTLDAHRPSTLSLKELLEIPIIQSK